MKLSHIVKSYGKQTVFRDFSLEIREGEILCILGASGVGKTTLLNILAGITPYEGTAENIPEKISYIFQEPRLLPNLTVRQNLAFAGGERARIERLLNGVELAEHADKRPSQLSGGQRQRAAIARAFCLPFDLLLMDEPFSSLDTALKIRLTELFAKLWQEEGKRRSAVFVTHDLEEALMLADRIVVLKEGKVAYETELKKEKFPADYGRACAEREKLLSILL
ncbi:MAG: ABC transporter ATP-binding protein [Clostridia bacterium]|nr:ABC transporter ATP-binding protein [Clostridia bacterium]